MKKIFLAGILVLLAASCGKTTSPTPSIQNNNENYNYNHQLLIGDKNLNVQVVTTQADMEQGLSGRSSLGDNQGMLFDFTKLPQYSASGITPGFWMKDMQFGLDFIWIYKNKIIGITPDVAAPRLTNQPVSGSASQQSSSSTTQLVNYFPPSPIDWVVEVNAGLAKKNNITVGDEAVMK